MIYEKDTKFYCLECHNPVTLYSENRGEGFRTRCKPCNKTSYFPACNICAQAVWKHDQIICDIALAKSRGKKYCRKCNTEKELKDFNYKGESISSRCKVCQAVYFKSWYESHKKQKNIDDLSKDDTDVSDYLEELFREY